ncbi:hypothetical protein [Lentzea sp. NPDC004782]|uniref:hypothetical protein n=1 Tax=Lentzea sp. NPDC004782 TaxID=3154458 RepID=UPI0033BC19A0
MEDTQQNRRARRRSIAWVYYAILAAVGVWVGFSTHIAALFPGLLCALYSVYLFRGGRFVLWIW